MAPKPAAKAPPAKAAPAAKAAPPAKAAPAAKAAAPAKAAPAAAAKKGDPPPKSTSAPPPPPPEEEEEETPYEIPDSGAGELADLLAMLKGGGGGSPSPVKIDFGPTIEEPKEKPTSAETLAYIANLKAKIALLERQLNDIQAAKKPSPALTSDNPFERVPELEKQIFEMLDTIEMLTLDKEQLMLDVQHLTENYSMLQVEFEAAKKAAMAGAEPGEVNYEDLSKVLQIENEKLREALRRLSDISTKDKETIKQLAPTMQQLEDELRDLKAFKRQAEENIELLRGKMDSMSDFERMIEDLTEKNLELKSKISEYQQEISDLEYAQEVNEELDAQQRVKIESDRAVTEQLNKKIIELEKKFTEKEYTIIEQKKKMDALKVTSKALKEELEHIEQMRQFESMESSSLQAKLQEAAALRTNQELLVKEASSLYNQVMYSNAAKLKFQSMYSRMNSLFGDNHFYQQEARLLNVEVCYITTMVSGFNAVRMLAGHLDSFLTHKFLDAPDAQVAALSKLHLLLLQSQSFSVQATVFAFKEPLTGAGTDGLAVAADKGLAFMNNLRNVFERTINASKQLATVDKAKPAGGKHGAKKDAVNNLLYEDENNEESVLEASRNAQLKNVTQEFESTIEELVDLLRSTASGGTAKKNSHMGVLGSSGDLLEKITANVITGVVPKSASSSGDEKPTTGLAVLNPAVQVEMLYMSINTLCDVGLYQPIKPPPVALPAPVIAPVVAVAPPPPQVVVPVIPAPVEATEQPEDATNTAEVEGGEPVLGAEERKGDDEDAAASAPVEVTEQPEATTAEVEGGEPVLGAEEHKGDDEDTAASAAVEAEPALPEVSDSTENAPADPEPVPAPPAFTEPVPVVTESPPAVVHVEDAVDWEREALLHRFHDYFKSIKLEVKNSLLAAKANGDHFASSLQDLKDAYKQLLSCFNETTSKLAVVDITTLSAEKQEEVQQLLKGVLGSVRKINHHGASSSFAQTTLSSPEVTKYFPTCLMTQIISTTGAVGSEVQEEMALRDNFNNHVDKYWDIIIQGSSELLAVSGDMASMSHEANWKHRIADLHKVIDSGASHHPVSHATSSATPASSSTAAASAASQSISTAHPTILPGSMVSKETYNKLKNELEVKKDELKIALRRVEELSGNIKDTSLQSAKNVAAKLKRNFFLNRANRPEVDPLAPQRMTEIGVDDLQAMKKEIRDLEDVLQTTEEKLDSLTRESKVMKQILQQPQAYQMSNMSMLAAPPSPDKAGKRHLGLLPSGLDEGNSPSAAAILQHLMLTSHHHLMDQALFWRRLALKRLTATLSPLPSTRLFHQEEAQLAAMNNAAAKAEAIAATKASHNITSSLSRVGGHHNQPLVKIEVVDKPFQNETLDRKTLYRDLRRMRADCVRVKEIEDDGRDLQRLQTQLALLPPLPLRAVISPIGERARHVDNSSIGSAAVVEGPPGSRRCKSHTSVLMFRIVSLPTQSAAGQ